MNHLEFWASWATIVAGITAAGGVILWVAKRFIRAEIDVVRQDTQQLQHNGGSHVADYARDSRDLSQKTLDLLREHMVDSARKEGAYDVRLRLLERDRL